MKNIILRYGTYALLIAVFIPFGLYLIIGGEPDTFTIGEIVGYGSIVLSLLFVFLGMKTYRDKENDGNLSFLEGFKIGILITIIPSIGFGLYNLVYVLWIDTEFTEKYLEYSLNNLKASVPAEEYAAAAVKMQEDFAIYDNLWVQFFLMFATVFILGFIVTILSALILKTKK